MSTATPIWDEFILRSDLTFYVYYSYVVVVVVVDFLLRFSLSLHSCAFVGIWLTSSEFSGNRVVRWHDAPSYKPSYYFITLIVIVGRSIYNINTKYCFLPFGRTVCVCGEKKSSSRNKKIKCEKLIKVSTLPPTTKQRRGEKEKEIHEWHWINSKRYSMICLWHLNDYYFFFSAYLFKTVAYSTFILAYGWEPKQADLCWLSNISSHHHKMLKVRQLWWWLWETEECITQFSLKNSL